MKFKKRRKSSRFAGSQTAHRGAKQRTRGSGNQGGKGLAGTGKRGDQKKTLVIKLTGGNNYFGKDRTLRRGNIPGKLEVINLDDLSLKLQKLIEQGKAKENNGVYEISLPEYKILGEGELTFKAKITAASASQSAQEKIKKNGGEIIVKNPIRVKKPAIIPSQKTSTLKTPAPKAAPSTDSSSDVPLKAKEKAVKKNPPKSKKAAASS